MLSLPFMLDNGDPIDSVAHIIQVALTPVFLLSAIGTLLNVFNTRISRVSDHREHATEMLRAATEEAEKARLRAHLRRLSVRTLMLDASLMLGATGAASICGAAMVLFVGSLHSEVVASWLFALFGIALGCAVAALVAFLADTLLAWHGLRREGPLPHIKAR